jgi:hypothetical protein|nr:MAG TPA: hypothetical protein [Caudoviricetes sp.]
MTREDIANSLKPLEWLRGEDHYGNQIIYADLLKKTAYIKEFDGGHVSLFFGRDNGNKIDVIKTYGGISMSVAKVVAREWQISEMCNYFDIEL